MKQFSALFVLFLLLATLRGQSLNAVQIGSSANAYSTYMSGAHPLSLLRSMGSNGGSLSFVYRENPAVHTGGNSGRLRYSISTDGGSTWTSERGVLNPLSSFASRYPNAILFNPNPPGNNLNQIKMALIAPTLNATSAGFEGHLMGLIDSVARPAGFFVRQESYLYGASSTLLSTQLPKSPVMRVPDEFWYVAYANAVRDIILYKGRYDVNTNSILWVTQQTISPTYAPATQQPQDLHLAFDPTGQIGYIAYAGDLSTGVNGVYSPVFIKTTDGGLTWGTPEEVNMTQFPTLVDSLQSAPGGQGMPTIGSIYQGLVVPNGMDLSVDADGRPHLLALVGDAPSATAPAYNMATTKYLIVDFTQDSAGRWMGKYISRQNTRRGVLGDPSITNGIITIDAWLTATRSADGTKLFFSWTDTDSTAAGWTPAAGNNNPNLLGRGFDIRSGRMTPIRNWSTGDTQWRGRVLTPMVPQEVIERGNQFVVPTVAMRMSSNTTSSLLPVSYWYFPGISYASGSFSDTTVSFLTCASMPMTLAAQTQGELCGLANGEVTVAVVNSPLNPSPYQYRWSNNQQGATVQNLRAGTYTVTVSDRNGCSSTLSATINNLPGPVLDSALSVPARCFGAANGSASVSVSGGLAPYQYQWSTGSSTASASQLSAGAYQVSVTDANGCTLITSVLVGEPLPVSGITAGTNPKCAGAASGTAGAIGSGGTPGYRFLWSSGDTTANALNLPAGSYTVTISDVNGCTGSASVVLIDPGPVTSSMSSVPTRCPGSNDGQASVFIVGGVSPYTYFWSNGSTGSGLNGVGAGKYKVTVTDANGCRVSDSVLVSSPDSIRANASLQQISCNGRRDGRITLAPAGGTGPYTFVWSNGASTATISNLQAGLYTVILRDANNCAESFSIRLEEPSPLILAVNTSPDNGTGNGAALASAGGGTPPYTYAWNTGQNGPQISGLFAGNYIVLITDARGCTRSDTVTISSNVSVDPGQDGQWLKLYPNPTSGRIRYAVQPAAAQPLYLRLTDMQGRILQQRVSPPQELEGDLSLDTYSAGIYLLQVQQGGRSVWQRIELLKTH